MLRSAHKRRKVKKCVKRSAYLYILNSASRRAGYLPMFYACRRNRRGRHLRTKSTLQGTVRSDLSFPWTYAVVAHMDLIEWDIFREERDYGFRYTIEDVGIASILEQAGFPAQFRRFWTNTMSTFRKDADCFVLHTNAGK